MVSPFFSVIVPIYKVEQYLPECIESVLNQNFQDYELILVDDGSPDNCGVICDDYAQKNAKVKVIHKINGGLSDARNSGMKLASGRYIVFLDGDDSLTKNCLLDIYKSLNNNSDIDMLICNFNNNINSSTTLNFDRCINVNISEAKSGIELLYAFLSHSVLIPWGAWRSIYKREVIVKHSIEFEINLIGAEDCDFFNKYINGVSNFKFLETPIVNYRQARIGSISVQKSFACIFGELKTFAKYFQYYLNINIGPHQKNLICSYYANWFCNAVAIISYLTDENEIKAIVSFIKQNSFILRYSNGLKYTLAKIIWKVFGCYNGSKLLKRIQEITDTGNL